MAFARGIAKLFGEIGQHRVQHPRVHGRGGVVVHIDGSLHGWQLIIGLKINILLNKSDLKITKTRGRVNEIFIYPKYLKLRVK